MTIKRITICLACKLFIKKNNSVLSDTEHFSLMNPVRAEHSQKVAINTKITLLNNKYISEVETLFKGPRNAQLLINQINFRVVIRQIRQI